MLRRYRSWVVASLYVAGCGTAIDSQPSGTSHGAPVDATQLFGKEVPPCAAGYEHPNICCLGAAYEATVCSEDLTHPFSSCSAGKFTYPDPNACCLLGNNDSCVQPSGNDVSADAGRRDCQNPCAPGAHPPTSTGMLCCYGTGLSCESTQLWCSLCTSPPAYCPTPCPAGWSVPATQPDLCCQEDSGEKTLCYSQSVWIKDLSGGSVARSDSTTCTAEQFAVDGNSYVMTCNFGGSNDCSCLRNGAVTKTLSSDQCDIGLCAFPQ